MGWRMRIVVTGALGFIGTEVTSRLVELDHRVVVVDFWDDLLRSYEASRYPILERVYANLSRAAEILRPDEFIGQLREYSPDVIVHLGASVDTTDMGSTQM